MRFVPTLEVSATKSSRLNQERSRSGCRSNPDPMDLAGGIKSAASSLPDGASSATSNPNGKPQNKIKKMLKTTFLTITGKVINLHDHHNTLFGPDAAELCFSHKGLRSKDRNSWHLWIQERPRERARELHESS